MNYFPGMGLGSGTGILGDGLGQQSTETFQLCRISGTLLTPLGTPVGTSGQTLTTTAGGTVITPTWTGVDVTAAVVAALEFADSIITLGKVVARTDSAGYFELAIMRGLTVQVTCPVLGKSILVDTTGQTEIDLSTYF